MSLTLDRDYGVGKWTKANWPKRGITDAPDNGLMPLDIPEVLSYLCDVSHRVKVIGNMCYKLLKGFDPRPTKAPKIPWNQLSKIEKEKREKSYVEV